MNHSRALDACYIRAAFVALAFSLSASPVNAQLAITEVMSNAAIDSFGRRGSDFWELTNFGTNAIDLSGYTFSDSSHGQLPLPSAGLFIAPGESVIFFRNTLGGTTNEAQFREWWGLQEAPVVRDYPTPGFASSGETLTLFDSEGGIADQVSFGPSQPGFSFGYDTNSGLFGVVNHAGVCGAFETRETHDIGSPGINCGHVPLRVVTEPTNLTVTAGMDASLVIQAVGLPRPRYQWLFNGQPISGATLDRLWVTNSQPSDVGVYRVLVSNGLEEILGSAITLSVLTNPCPPSIIQYPAEASTFFDETAHFTVSLSGYPAPALQWLCNGIPLANETNRTLSVPYCTLEMSGSRFCVEAVNPLGSAKACATLTVTELPDLRFTEVMARKLIDNPPHRDWFELTSFHTNAVDLKGYRYSPIWDLRTAQVVSNSVVLRPGESVIFVDGLTRQDFLDWWGAENLPADLQIITWQGFGISPQGGEMLNLWGPSTEDPAHAVAQVFIGSSLPFTSLYFDQEACLLGCNSQPGMGGAFQASMSSEIGSPGYSSAPLFMSITPEKGGILIKARGIPSKTYVLSFKTDLKDSFWIELSRQTATSSGVSFRDVFPLTQSRFYCLREVP